MPNWTWSRPRKKIPWLVATAIKEFRDSEEMRTLVVKEVMPGFNFGVDALQDWILSRDAGFDFSWCPLLGPAVIDNAESEKRKSSEEHSEGDLGTSVHHLPPTSQALNRVEWGTTIHEANQPHLVG
ncbi:hypothetical protein NE237_020602 [Protea cynaroides]|uniref:Uncharacterized protein n=1 Tax=Protea cynaroides TaxID=273540 RepID=A0A9Q0K2R3_9MAGN|nr:hypothetical protein NE237_020602 [Protea cynaroides]